MEQRRAREHALEQKRWARYGLAGPVDVQPLVQEAAFRGSGPETPFGSVSQNQGRQIVSALPGVPRQYSRDGPAEG